MQWLGLLMQVLTGNIPGEGSGVAGATSVLTGMSGLTASG